MNDTTPIAQNVITNPVLQYVPVNQTFVSNQFEPRYGYNTTTQYQQPIVYQPPATQTIVSGYRTPSVHFGYNQVGTTNTYGITSAHQGPNQGSYPIQGKYT